MLVYNTVHNTVADIPEGDARALQTFLGDSHAYWEGQKAFSAHGGITSPQDYYQQLYKLLGTTNDWHRCTTLAESIRKLASAMSKYQEELDAKN